LSKGRSAFANRSVRVVGRRRFQFLNQLIQLFHALSPDGAIVLEPFVQIAKPIPAQPVKTLIGARFHVHQPRRLQNAQVLRHLRLREPKPRPDLAHGAGTVLQQLDDPFLLLQSDYGETHHSDFFINGNGKLLAHMTAPGFHYEIKHANHYSFTDAPFFVAPPGRFLLARVMGGGRGPAAAQQATADIVAAFLIGPLTGAASDLAATAARYPEVVGGAVEPKPALGFAY
jgi:hypothetical protein